MTDLTNHSYAELLALQDELAKQLKAKQKDAKKEGIQKYKDLIALAETVKKEYGLTDADLKGTKRAGRKLEPKYRDPKTGKTWTGQGAAARFVKEYEAAGGNRDDLLINKP